jgi:hypothetical protein
VQTRRARLFPARSSPKRVHTSQLVMCAMQLPHMTMCGGEVSGGLPTKRAPSHMHAQYS